jgi:hypothetical protein
MTAAILRSRIRQNAGWPAKTRVLANAATRECCRLMHGDLAPRRRNGIHLNLDLAIFYANRITADLDAGIICPYAIGDAKSPGVPGTSDNIAFYEAAAERSAHVRAHIVDGVETILAMKDGNEFA